MKQLPQELNINQIEKKWQDFWQENQTYKFDHSKIRADNFVIDTPPPTVSGLLHMGHIFSYTQTDFVARYQRMKGKNVFYPIGFDDNGLPTERLVEKTKNIRAVNMNRQEFIDICNEVVLDAEQEFRELFKSISLSVDWNLEYRTISEDSRKISQMSFMDLFEKEQAYRKPQPVLWDPIDQTALSQADIVDLEFESTMNNIVFTTESGEEIIIATTRPELIAACVCVFYNPNDTRYQKFKNQNAITALFGVKVPILEDEAVDIEKGTGLVMCCTFGDITDIDWWKKHNLKTRVIVNKVGRIYNLEQMGSSDWECTDLIKAKSYIEQINGLKIKEARVKTLELLAENNLLKEQIAIKHHVKCAERSGFPLEIIISPQWFIKVLDKKEQFLKRAEECNWHPEYMKYRLDNWINGINWDWCISRQRFFGVPFPAWYSKRPGEEGKILIAHKDDLPVDPIADLPRGYTRDEVEPDIDVMDTWATSSVSPQLASLAINKDYAIDLDRHERLFPADLRPQAHEIIRTWAFYTIVKSELHQQTIPWKNLIISGWCLAADKTKMSKSKGNVITPKSLIDEKGSDIIRYWASTSKLGADTAYSEDLLKIGKKLVNKIWNAAKFSAIHIEKIKKIPTSVADSIKSGDVFEQIDLWLLKNLEQTIIKASEEFENFEYCNARCAIEDFFWNVFCDNYLELVKVRIYDEDKSDEKGQQSAIIAIYHTMETLLKLFAPILPHLTEEIYQHLFAGQAKEQGSIHAKNSWPKAEDYAVDQLNKNMGDTAVEILDIVRRFKSDRNLSLKTTIHEITISSNDNLAALNLTPILHDLKNVTNATNISIITSKDEANDSYIDTKDGIYHIAIAI